MKALKIKLRTLLLSVFLFTIIVASTLIISFTHAKYSKSIHKLSLETIDRAGYRIYEKIECIIHETEKLPAAGILFLKNHPEISLKNTALTDFFLGILEHDPNALAYYAGFPDGSYIIATHLLFSNQGLYPSTPQEAAFVILLSNRSIQNAPQMRAYFKRDLSLLSIGEFPQDFDPRPRPWYLNAEKNRSLFWSDPYSPYFLKGDPGLSVSEPFYDLSGKLLCVVGADLSFNLFSELLKNQTFSKNGKAFILNGEGKVLLPKGVGQLEQNIASQAFIALEKTKKHDFSYAYQREKYLASFHPFPTFNDKHWSIAFIAPLSDFFGEVLQAQRTAVFISICVLLAASLMIVILSIHISRPIVQISQEIDRIARLDLESQMRSPSHIAELSLIDESVSSMREALRSFTLYVPKEIAKQLMRKDHKIALGGKKKTIAIFFTDIANFSTIAEKFPVETVNLLLTEYFEILTTTITECGGTVDKYIGDSIMSIWGAPDDLPDFAIQACTAALLCQNRLSSFHEKCRNAGMPELSTRMGIKVGPVIVGNFGTTERMNYSAIGDAVNIAARLQALNKTYCTHILLDEETVLSIGTQFLTRPLEVVELKGKKTRIKIFELLAKQGDQSEIQPKPHQLTLCSLFTEAFNAFERGDLARAKVLFESIHQQFPEDRPTIHYLQKY